VKAIKDSWEARQTARTDFEAAVDALTARDAEFDDQWQGLLDQVGADAVAVVAQFAAVKPQDPSETNTDQQSGDNDA